MMCHGRIVLPGYLEGKRVGATDCVLSTPMSHLWWPALSRSIITTTSSRLWTNTSRNSGEHGEA